jgi:ribokinase
MDLVLRVARMPLPGETLTGGAFRTIPGGKGANQAVACARLGGGQPVAMIGCVGDDAFGQTLRAALVADGIDVSHVTALPGVASGIASILVDAHGQNSIVIAGGANDLLAPAHIDAALALIAQASIVVLQLETPLATVRHAIAVAHGLGKTVVLNPAPAASLSLDLLAQIDYLVPNEIEAAMLVGDSSAGSVAADAAAALQALGDTTAAGDTFIGGFVAALAAGRDAASAIALGQRAAAIGVTRHGAQTSIPYLHELELP